MFFGLTTSPATFQMMMNMLFHELIAEGNFMVYMDDMAVHTAPLPGKTHEQHLKQHRSIVRRMLKILDNNDLFLNPDKCHFEQDHANFLRV